MLRLRGGERAQTRIEAACVAPDNQRGTFRSGAVGQYRPPSQCVQIMTINHITVLLTIAEAENSLLFRHLQIPIGQSHNRHLLIIAHDPSVAMPPYLPIDEHYVYPSTG